MLASMAARFSLPSVNWNMVEVKVSIILANFLYRTPELELG